MPAPIDLTGRRFGRLRVTTRAAGAIRGSRAWNAVCDCGTTVVASATALHTGHTTSCGCRRADANRARTMTHGGTSGGSRSPEFNAWLMMIARCTDPRVDAWPWYGGRGIAVCRRWSDSFEAFLADVGPRPGRGYSIDRVDSDGHYEPGNVRWATMPEQIRNRRSNVLVTIDGRTMCVADWAAERGLNANTIYRRIHRGMSPTDALTRPIRRA